MERNKELALKKLSDELAERFSCWETLYQNGGSDPFWPDGINLNLVRNHIIYYKRQMEDLLQEEDESLTLFPMQYPDVYYRETPDAVDPKFMVKADSIRARAKEQLALYEQDPNFRYILSHHNEVFPKGETKATKQAGLYPGKTGGYHRYRECIQADDLVSMRRNFREDYEKKAERWVIYANDLRAYLSSDHSQDDLAVVEDYEDEPEEDICESDEELEDSDPDLQPKEPPPKRSLQNQLEHAKEKVTKDQVILQKEDQLSLF